MQIESVRIENFRSAKDLTILLGNYNCLVGPNGGGKSTILNALNVFFRESRSSMVNLHELSKEDFHLKDTTNPIRITVTFTDLSPEATETLKDYVRQDKLVVTAVAKWSDETQTAPVIQKGIRMGIDAFRPFFAALGDEEPVKVLLEKYVSASKTISGLPTAKTKQAMIDALRSYEDAHPDQCNPIESADEFYGVSRGAHRLGPFIQWVFIPAVKDATTEQSEAKDTALGRLVERTVRSKVDFSTKIKELQDRTSAEYDKLLSDSDHVLGDLSTALRNRLLTWAHPGVDLSVKWDKDPKKAVKVEEPYAHVLAGESGFIGELARLGHGLQRSFLLAILEELASNDQTTAPRLILGIEEPELFQHPPQVQHLSDVLESLSDGNAQIIACSHSPYFVVAKGFEDVRLIRKSHGSSHSECHHITYKELATHLHSVLKEKQFDNPEGTLTRLNQILQLSQREMFFASRVVFVEGHEDGAYITAALHLQKLWKQWRTYGIHIVPVLSKANLLQPIAIAQLMNIPFMAIYDSDGPANAEQPQPDPTENARLIKLLGATIDNFPPVAQFGKTYVTWPRDIGSIVRADYTPDEWELWKTQTNVEIGGGKDKNPLLIAGILTKAWASGKPSPSLVKLCDHLLAFGAGSINL